MIVGWKSPVDDRVYALDDYAPLSRFIPEPVLRAMTNKAMTDDRHSGTNITITGGLSCPRKTLITRALPTTPDPTKMWKMQRGTWLHECVGLNLAANDEWWTEEGDANACTFEGVLFGIKMSCRVDALKRDYSTLMDWKFRADGAEKFVDPMGRASDNDAAQVNMARMLIEQVTGKDLSAMDLYVWVMSGATVRTTAPYMSEAQVGAIRPGGGMHSVNEIFALLSDAMKQWALLGDNEVTKVIASMPMVGESMFANPRTPSLNMCTRYCEVQEQCYSCNGGI